MRQEERLVSRPLLLGWCLWLLVSWALHLMFDGPVATPAIRWMLLSALIGIMIAWPVWRLSLPTPLMPTLSTLSDLFFLWLIFQVLVLRVGIDWPIDHAILIDAAVTTYALAAGWLVDVGRRLSAAGRSVAMIGCVALLVVPAFAAGELEHSPWIVFSPVHAIWLLADPTTMLDADAIGWSVGVLAAAVVFLWLATRFLVIRLAHGLPSDRT